MQQDIGNEILVRQIKDTQVASIRFLGYPQEIPQRFDQLEKIAAQYASGKPIFLYHWGYPGPEQDIELCLPVVQPVHSAEVNSRILNGGHMLTTRHHGAYEQIPESWRKLSRYVQENRIGWGNGPGREVYLEGPENYADQKEKYVTEIQIPMLQPEWIGHLDQGIERILGETTARYVLGQGHRLAHNAPARERALWVQGMLERLEEALPEEEQQHEVLAACSHVFPQRRIEQLRAIYHQTGDLDTVIAFMHEDRSEKGANYYESPRREGELIRVTKIPFDAQGYQSAQTSLEKKLAYCHCPMVKDAMREGISLSPAYCHCGAGWYHTLWEGILKRRVRVDVVRSLLNGDDTCEFTIHLT